MKTSLFNYLTGHSEARLCFLFLPLGVTAISRPVLGRLQDRGPAQMESTKFQVGQARAT